jgi:hypothetical protein
MLAEMTICDIETGAVLLKSEKTATAAETAASNSELPTDTCVPAVENMHPKSTPRAIEMATMTVALLRLIHPADEAE